MQDEQKAVETTVETIAAAPQTGVETSSSASAPADDPEAKLNALLEENEKLRSDRDNYRKVAMAVKSKSDSSDVDLTDPDQLHAYISKTVSDKLLETREAETTKELIDFAKELARKNKALATAVANRSQLVSASTGSGATGVETKNNSYWSPDQEDALRKRWKSQGIPDERIEKMILKAEQNVRSMK